MKGSKSCKANFQHASSNDSVLLGLDCHRIGDKQDSRGRIEYTTREFRCVLSKRALVQACICSALTDEMDLGELLVSVYIEDERHVT